MIKAFQTAHLTIVCCAYAIGLVIFPNAMAHGTVKHESKKAIETIDAEQLTWGIADSKANVGRTITVRMDDSMRFSPAALEIAVGETVRFVIENKGKLLHEFVLGDDQTLKQHAALMVKFPNMEHEEPYMAHVNPGETGEIIWKFNRIGVFSFACLIAGHYQAGMVGSINVGRKPAGIATKN